MAEENVNRRQRHGGQLVKSTPHRDSIEAEIAYVAIALIVWMMILAASLVIMRP